MRVALRIDPVRDDGPYGTLGAVLASISFYYGHRDPVSVTAG
jgi:hypothetical protein